MQTRVYYLDDDNSLVELGWNQARGWFKGALTNAEFEATAGSVITTAVTKEQLKVYYRGKDKSGQARLWVAYVAINQTGWLRRPVMSFQRRVVLEFGAVHSTKIQAAMGNDQ